MKTRADYLTSLASIDREPWVNPEGHRVSNAERIGKIYFRSPGEAIRYEYRPRPERANPILIAFRKHGANLFGGIDGWLKYAMGGVYADGLPITPDHIEHARKVLTRLAALEKITEGQEN